MKRTKRLISVFASAVLALSSVVASSFVSAEYLVTPKMLGNGNKLVSFEETDYSYGIMTYSNGERYNISSSFSNFKMNYQLHEDHFEYSQRYDINRN